MVRDSIKFCGWEIPLPKSSCGYWVLAIMTVIGCFACGALVMFSLGYLGYFVIVEILPSLGDQFLNVLKILGFVFVGVCMVVFLMLCFSEDGLLR